MIDDYEIIDYSIFLERKLYKFFSNVKYGADSIKKKSVHLDKPDEFNDPFETNNVILPTDCKVSCFSEINDSILMWSYYANKHKGICVEYDVSLLEDDELNQIIRKSITRVTYSPLKANTKNSIESLFYKAEEWSHEREWRIVCNTNEEFLPFDCISGVYLGLNSVLENENIKELIKICKRREIRIYKAYFQDNNFKIIFREI